MTKWVDEFEIDGHRIRLRRDAGGGWCIVVDGVERGAIGASLDDQPNDVYDRLEKWWRDQQTTNARFPDTPNPTRQREEGQPPRA